MASLPDILRRAARRILFQRAIRWSGRALAAALIAACALLAVDRAFAQNLPWTVFGLIGATGFALGVILAALRRPTRSATAVLLDRTLGLKDRLGSAETLLDEPRRRRVERRFDPEFAALVRRDADRTAGTANIKAATPIRITNAWAASLVLAAFLSLGFLYLPAADWFRRGPSPEEIARRAAARQQQRSEIAEVIEQAVVDLDDDQALDDTAREELDILKDLAQQLSGENVQVDPDEARDESAASLNELAERLADQAERDAAASDELARRFAGLEEPDEPSPAQEVAEAIKRGDYGRAADALEQALGNPEAMTEQQRRAMAEQLRELKEQLDQALQEPDGDSAERREHLEQALRDQGLNEQKIDEMLDRADTPPDELERDLRQDNVDERIAERLAHDIQQLREERQVDEQVQRDLDDVADALDRAADDLEQPEPQPPPTEQQTPPQPPQPPAGEPQQQLQDESPPEPDRTREGEQPPAEQQDTPRQQQQRGPQEQRRQQQPPQEQPGQQQRGPQQQRRPGEPQQPPGDQAPPARQPDPQRRPQEQRESPQPRPQETPQPEKPDAGQDQRPLGKILRDLERRRRDAEDRRSASERLRERARELGDNMTEEQRRRWAQPRPEREDKPPREQSGPGAGRRPGEQDQGRPGSLAPEGVEDLDIRGEEPSQQPGEDLAGDFPLEGEPQRTTRSDPLEQVRRARRIAERAVDEQAVPSRYHELIRRYFNRLGSAAEQDGSSSSDPSSDSSSSGAED